MMRAEQGDALAAIVPRQLLPEVIVLSFAIWSLEQCHINQHAVILARPHAATKPSIQKDCFTLTT